MSNNIFKLHKTKEYTMYRYLLFSIVMLFIFNPLTKSESKSYSLILLLRDKYPFKEELIDVYKKYLENNDYVIVFPGINSLNYITDLKGFKGTTFFSINDIRSSITLLQNNVNYITYNIEHNLSPNDEIYDPVNSVKLVSDIVHKHNIKLILTPSGRLTELYAKEFAKYTDVYVLQYQALQSTPEEYERYVKNIVKEIRDSNPNVKVIAQVSTLRGDMKSMIDSFNRVKEVIDGITIFYGLDKEEISKLDKFLSYIDNFRRADYPLNSISLVDINKSNESISFIIVNNNNLKEELILIVKIKDEKGIIDIKFYNYTLEALESESTNLSIGLKDNYKAEIFVWSDLDHATPLSTKHML